MTQSNSRINVAVLMGGRSEEREVSLSTGKMILNALDPSRYNAFGVDTALLGNSDVQTLDENRLSSSLAPLIAIFSPGEVYPKPDVVFIALHGKYGEDGTVQGLLELLGIPYVGSGVLASALAMDKVMTRKILDYHGIPLPKGFEIELGVDIDTLTERIISDLGFPVVVKPSRQGSTIGLSIVKSPNDLPNAVELAFSYDDQALVEEFIDGTEITVPVIGYKKLEALPVVEIVPKSGFYDYHAKYTPGATEEIVPARIPQAQYAYAQELGILCHDILGCRDMSRTDMIVRGDSVYVLEVNTIPGMTPTSLLPRSAQSAGIDFPELLDRLISYALSRR
jgi:D-alanine-D-alanine ligase